MAPELNERDVSREENMFIYVGNKKGHGVHRRGARESGEALLK